MSKLSDQVIGQRRLRLQRIGSLLKEQRLVKRMTLAELGEIAGLSLSCISKIEGGHHSAGLLTFLDLCQALRVSPANILASALDLSDAGPTPTALNPVEIRVLRALRSSSDRPKK